MYFMKNLFYFSLLLIFVSSCNQQSSEEILAEIAAENETTILEFIEDNNLTAQRTDNGLYYVITDPGGEAKPDINSTVEVVYKGYFVDDVVFDQTPAGTTSVFPLTNVIEGWQQGIPLFGKGGTGIIMLPSALAYGTRGQGSIAPNEVIIFDINLIDF